MDETFDRFTERARKVLSLAQEESYRFNHNYIGTEHLLLGLVREQESVAASVLANLGVELNKVRAAVEFIIGRGDRIVLGDIGLTPRAKDVLGLAVDEARRLGSKRIGTEHLLLGLIREGEGIAAGVLESLGVNLERARAAVMLAVNAPGAARFALAIDQLSPLRAAASWRAAAPRERLTPVITLVCRNVTATAAFYQDYLSATVLDVPEQEARGLTGAERLLRLPYGAPLLALRPAEEGADEAENRGVGGVELSFFTTDGDALWAALQARDTPRLSPVSELPGAEGAKTFTLADPDGRRLRVFGVFGG